MMLSSFRNLLQKSPIRILIATGFLWLSVFVLLKIALWREPHSAFFKSDNVYNFDYSAIREREAARFLQDGNNTGLESELRSARPTAIDPEAHFLEKGKDVIPEISEARSSPTTPIICAAFVTIKREGQQYLEQSIGSMLDRLYPEERAALYLYILFADTNPSLHPNWNHSWTRNSSIVNQAETYNISDSDMERVKSAQSRRDWYDKGLFDYQYVLEKCMNDTKAPYVAIFEDDIIFADGWLARSLNALAELKGKVGLKRWIYLRLFYTETALRWRKEEDFWFRNLHLAFGVVIAWATILLVIVRRVWPKTQRYLTPFNVAVVCLVTIPSFTALFFMAGKYTTFPLQGLEQMNRHGCCTQGMIYPRQEVPSLLQYFRDRVTGQTDTLIEEYSDREGLDRYALAPQMVQHVGRVSSRDNDATTTKSTWAFWFETYRPARMEREHKEAFENINWASLRKDEF